MASMIEAIKIASRMERENSQPSDLRTGTVISTTPLQIKISDVFILNSQMVTVPQRLTDYEVEIELDGAKKKIKVLNKLKTGDRVVMQRSAGGQQFTILDKVV